MSSFKYPIRLAWPEARFVPLSDAAGGATVPLPKPLTLIGSGTGVHVCLQTRTVEEFHACILNTDGRVYLRDLGTLGGVLVNSDRVQEAELRDGDGIQIGKMEFRFETGPPPNPGTIPLPVEPAELALPGRRVPLGGRVILVGRGPRCDLRLDDDEVFEKHALIYSADGKWHVRILTPGPGTLLNERAVRRASFRHGDTLSLGRSELRYWRVGAEFAPAAPAAPITLYEESPPIVEASIEPRAPESTNMPPVEEHTAQAPLPEEESPPEEPTTPRDANDSSGSSASLPPLTVSHPPSDRGSVDLEMIRGWGPLAAAMAAAQQLEPEPPDEHASEHRTKSRRWLLAVLGAVFVLGLAFAGAVWWWKS